MPAFGFYGYEERGQLMGVMGVQDVKDVTLLAACLCADRSSEQGHRQKPPGPCESSWSPGRSLVGTWAAASWAIAFYEKHGFTLVTPEEKERLLRTYWSIPDRQIETSVVLADRNWKRRGGSR